MYLQQEPQFQFELKSNQIHGRLAQTSTTHSHHHLKITQRSSTYSPSRVDLPVPYSQYQMTISYGMCFVTLLECLCEDLFLIGSLPQITPLIYFNPGKRAQSQVGWCLSLRPLFLAGPGSPSLRVIGESRVILLFMASSERKLFNRFDQYEIASFFTQTAEDLLPKKWKIDRTPFYIKCLLGVLLFLNGYLSHWGPWPWPSNYYFLIFSVVFYHLATYLYAAQSPVSNAEGNTIGQFRVQNKNVCVVLRIGESKEVYSLEALDKKVSLGRRDLRYNEYFTESGVFLSYKFKRDVEQLVKAVEQQASK